MQSGHGNGFKERITDVLLTEFTILISCQASLPLSTVYKNENTNDYNKSSPLHAFDWV